MTIEFDPSENASLKPSWEPVSREFRVGNILVKQFRVPAQNQELVLAAFEEDGWPPWINDPLVPRDHVCPKRRVHDTINRLNRNQKVPLIRFVGNGSGTGFGWELLNCDALTGERRHAIVDPTTKPSVAGPDDVGEVGQDETTESFERSVFW